MIDTDITRKEIVKNLPTQTKLCKVQNDCGWHRITDPIEGEVVFSESDNITDAYIRTDNETLLDLQNHR